MPESTNKALRDLEKLSIADSMEFSDEYKKLYAQFVQRKNRDFVVKLTLDNEPGLSKTERFSMET